MTLIKYIYQPQMVFVKIKKSLYSELNAVLGTQHILNKCGLLLVVVF